MTEPADIQPAVEVQPLDWGAYDVPRIWDAVRREDDFLAWEQVKGLENLARLLAVQQTRLRKLRESLVAAWDPDTHPAAAGYLALLDDLIASLERDAVAHTSTGHALHAILTTLKAAKERIGVLKRAWDSVTTDWIPQWWDSQAGDLNRRARHVIRQAEDAIADHRRRLVPAPAFGATVAATGFDPEPSKKHNHRPIRRILPPPPVPGYDPAPPATLPQSVPAVPGSPISLLPVPPGNPHAPDGGAYVLPGPGIGPGGWIYPRPGSPPEAGEAQRAGVWDVAQGVSPIIDEMVDTVPVPDNDFIDWFSELATPWTAPP